MDYQKKVFFVRCKKGTNHIVDVNQIKVHLRENIKEMRDWEVNDFVNYLFQNKKNDVKCGEDTIIDYNVMDDGPLNPLTISDIIEIELENLFRENLIKEIKKNKEEIQKKQIETNQNIKDSDSDSDPKLSFEGERTVGTEVKDKVDDHFNKDLNI